MIIDVLKLKTTGIESIEINEEVIIEQKKLDSVNILKLNNAKVTGTIFKSNDDYKLDLLLNGEMVLPCSISLKPVPVPFEVEIKGYFNDFLEEIGESFKKNQNTIDIFPIIWENILMEIPIKVVSPDSGDIVTQGEGWQLISDGERENINPEFQKLKDLFNEK